MENNGFMHAKEFARRLKTTKATLRHYRDIGLFEPAHITESGYALYSVTQISDYVLISALKSAGCSLVQIKDYLSLASTNELHDILTEKIADIETQQQNLELRKQILKTSLERADALHAWQNAISKEGPAWRMKESPEEYFIKTVIPLTMSEESEFFQAVEGHMRHCIEHGGGEGLQAAHSVERDCFDHGDYGTGFAILTRVSECIESDRLHIKPAGTYFCWLKHTTDASAGQREDANPLFDEYDDIRIFLKKRRSKLASDVYESALTLYSGSKQEIQYAEVEMLIV